MTKLMMWGQILSFVLVAIPNQSNADNHQVSLLEMQREIRLEHAHELLGKYYSKSAVRAGESVKKINSHIFTWTRERLPKKFKSQYKRVAQAIIDESMKHEFDPIFVMSVIQNESSFNPNMLGSLDEIGLMQIRPGTAEWIAKKYEMEFKGDHSLHDPVENIRIGCAYLDYLRDNLPNAQLYLSAYNMGKRNVERNLEEKTWPKEYANRVMKFYVDFYAQIKPTEHVAHKSSRKIASQRETKSEI